MIQERPAGGWRGVPFSLKRARWRRSLFFFVDRLANSVQNKQEVPGCTNLTEEVDLGEDLKFPGTHLVSRQQRLVITELLPGLVLGHLVLWSGTSGNQRAGFRMRQREKLLTINSQHCRDTAQEAQRRPPAIRLKISNVCRFDTELRGECSLSQSERVALFLKQLAQTWLVLLRF